MEQMGILVQGNGGHLNVTLIFHPTATLGEGMDYSKQRRQKNMFSFHTVRLNLPSGVNYTPSEPWA